MDQLARASVAIFGFSFQNSIWFRVAKLVSSKVGGAGSMIVLMADDPSDIGDLGAEYIYQRSMLDGRQRRQRQRQRPQNCGVFLLVGSGDRSAFPNCQFKK